ncbi:MAG: C4-dicarboxylate ABC transporter [Chloroflexi bacterium]|nr:C4-dicarboxylate ABC transporter [Chloroflexota bacterium]
MQQPAAQIPVAEHPTTRAQPRLRYLPISFFAMVLGLAGTTIAFQRAEKLLGLPLAISGYLLVGATTAFLVVAALYIAKLIRHPDAVRHEFAHPIKINFFPTISISMLLLSIAFLQINADVSRLLWMAGTIVQTLFTIVIISNWMQHTTFQVNHSNPSWFIPVVGNVIIPITGVEHAPIDVSWFFFSIGLIFWIALFTIFLNRIIFHAPLAERLLPTLFIMIAPPAVGFVAYVKLMEHAVDGFALDAFAKILYYFALFVLILLIAQYRQFITIKFYLSWWAYSFPVAAITIATILISSKTGGAFHQWLGYGLLVFLSILIVVLLVRTAGAIIQRQICVEEE